MKLIVAGSRSFNNYELLREKIDYFLSNNYSQVEIVSGTARGTDTLGERYANEKGFAVKQFHADWSQGKKAGYIRNEQMAKYGTHCICFWDGKSRGTMHMIELAKKYQLNLKVVYYDRP